MEGVQRWHDLPLAHAPVLGSQEIPGGQCSQPGTGEGVMSGKGTKEKIFVVLITKKGFVVLQLVGVENFVCVL